MINKIFLILFLVTLSYSQSDSLQILNKIEKLDIRLDSYNKSSQQNSIRLSAVEKENDSLRKETNQLKSLLEDQSKELKNYRNKSDSRINEINKTNSEIRKDIVFLKEELKIKIDDIDSSVKTNKTEFNEKIKDTNLNADKKISEVMNLYDYLKQNSIYAFIAVFILILLIITSIFALKFFMQKFKTTSSDQINESKRTIEEKTVHLDNKMLELFEKQIQLSNDIDTIKNQEPDHRQFIKISDELNRIEKNLRAMDESVKGYKQLKAAAHRMKEHLNSKDYEIVELLGTKYDEGMNIEVTIVPDDKLEQGKMVITNIVKPQLKYKGKIIQSGEVTVNQGV
ncbi:MAG: hypothetical protein WC212_00350 [Candidatus Delongbacteria bacterium]|jgi:predicted  nucleic acid-binding Zn-ribbon protein